MGIQKDSFETLFPMVYSQQIEQLATPILTETKRMVDCIEDLLERGYTPFVDELNRAADIAQTFFNIINQIVGNQDDEDSETSIIATKKRIEKSLQYLAEDSENGIISPENLAVSLENINRTYEQDIMEKINLLSEEIENWSISRLLVENAILKADSEE